MAKPNKKVKAADQEYLCNYKIGDVAGAKVKTSTSENIDDTIAAREENYGDYGNMADCIQDLKMIMNLHSNGMVDAALQESLDMICTKLGRILVGNAYHIDSWHDIAGYATCAEKYIIKIEQTEYELTEESV